MSRILITGSADGLGRAAARTLLAQGHYVVVHMRGEPRREAVQDLLNQGAQLVIGDLADFQQTQVVAEQVNEFGAMDAVIHNAGVYSGPAVLPVNVVAPYLLTALIHRPKRLVYLSSDMHASGRPKLDAMDWSGRHLSGSYSDSKLFVTAFAAAVARRWADVISSSVNPGWVPTKMGGPNAPDDLRLGHLTQEWLATSGDPAALVSGRYWHHQRQTEPHPASRDVHFQDTLVGKLEEATGISLPSS